MPKFIFESEFPKIEKKILDFWKKNKIIEKALAKPAKSIIGKGHAYRQAGKFVFYEGPPTANGRPGIHHVLARAFKDIILRYKTMRGYYVPRIAGWDTHGLPVELEVEKKLGIKNKSEIEKYGVGKFNKECKRSVWQYKSEWENFTRRIAFWIDLDHPYVTYENNYIEVLWRIIKFVFEKGLLEEDYRVAPHCPRCETSLSSHELAQPGAYRRVYDPSIYIKFKIKSPESHNLEPESYLLVWTTTPWTLPANAAVAVNPKEDYVLAKIESGENLIVAKKRLGVIKNKYEIIKSFLGSELLDIDYEPLFSFKKLQKRAHFVVSGNFVSMEDGTGLVHIAPAFGEDDLAVGKKFDLPFIQNVDLTGRFTTEVNPWQGIFVKEADPLIIKNLEERKIIFKKDEKGILHEYPFCWRCASPIIYYAKNSWFIRMTKLKNQLLENNEKINWLPAHLKEGRFGGWLKEIKDWNFSRERFWGTPLPVWKCSKCEKKIAVGSLKELGGLAKTSGNRYFLLRHCEADHNLKDITGPLDTNNYVSHITKKGASQIKKIIPEIKKLDINLIIASPLSRIKETISPIEREILKSARLRNGQGKKVKVIFDKRLSEINVGDFQGKSLKNFNNQFKNQEEKFTKRPAGKGAESLDDLKKRMVNFILSCEKKYAGKNILIASHGDPLWILETGSLGLSNKEILNYRYIETCELRNLDFKSLPFDEDGNLDFHKPYIDQIFLRCPECKGLAKRDNSVIDVWFDSGAMPFAQNPEGFWAQTESLKLKAKSLKKTLDFPADYIVEAVDQTRGWFYTLLAVSTLLDLGPAYKNAISLGHILDAKGQKMSKSKGNVIDPWEMVEKYGSDTLRWYLYTANAAGEPKLFHEKDLLQKLRGFISTLWNTYIFFETYSPAKNFAKKNLGGQAKISSHILDKWIISRFNSVLEGTTDLLESYDIVGAARTLEEFLINDFSNWHIRRSRRRFQHPQNKEEKNEGLKTLFIILDAFLRITAPFVPFLSEIIYQKLGNRSSIHLTSWPEVNSRFINKNLEEEMEEIRRLAELALKERSGAKIKVRQPLGKLKIKNEKLKNKTELLEILKDEVNVKKIEIDVSLDKEIWIDKEITEELKNEGLVREIIRQIQDMRKEADFKPSQKMALQIEAGRFNKIIESFSGLIQEETWAKLMIGLKSEKSMLIKRETEIEREKIWLGIKKL